MEEMFSVFFTKKGRGGGQLRHCHKFYEHIVFAYLGKKSAI